MARTFYVPVNSLSKRTKQWYVPVNGLSKKVSKAYCPVNGLSKLFWDGNGWRREADIPYNFYQGAAVVFQGKVHLLGGADNPTRHYSWDGTNWAEESTLPYNLTLGSAVVWNNKIHILGSSSALGAHYSWDGSSWTQEAGVPVNFYGENNAVIYDGYIHTISSWWGSYGMHRYVCKYDGTAWTSVINPANNSYASSASYDGKIYLLGASGTGGAGYQEYEDGVFGDVKSIPYQFSGGFALVYNGRIHMLGSAQRYVTKYHFGFDGTDFDSKSTMPYDFYYCPAVVYRGRIHIFGGNANRAEHWSYGEKGVIPFDNAEYIDITTLPTKLSYRDGESINIAGIVVHAYDKNDNDLGEISLSDLLYTPTASPHTGITANCDPEETGSSDAIVSGSNVTLFDWSHSQGEFEYRAPVVKINSGDAACMVTKNAYLTASDKWMLFTTVSDNANAGVLMMGSTRNGAGLTKINNINYYIAGPAANKYYGGVTVDNLQNPLGLPVLENADVFKPNEGSTLAQKKKLIRTIGVMWVGGAVTISTYRSDGKELKVQYGITVS